MRVVLAVAPILIKRCPLIGLGYVAAALKAAGHEVEIFDANTFTEVPNAEREGFWSEPGAVADFAERSPGLFDEWAGEILSREPGVVGFSTWSCNAPATLLLAERIRAMDSKPRIVLGGPEAGFKAEAFLARNCVDAVIPGEAERAFPDLIEGWARSGAAAPAPGPVDEIKDLDTLPFPDFTGFDLDGYFMDKTLPLSFNRGCIRKCVFCNIYESWKAYRHRSAESIYAEINHQLAAHPGTRHFEIDVAALNLDVRILGRLCDLILAGGRRFTWGGSAVFRPDMSPSLLGKLAAAGLTRLDIGFESGSPKILKLMKKGYLVEHAEAMLRGCKEAGIEVILNVIVGFPGEGERELQETKDFLARNRGAISKIGPPSELWIGNNNALQQKPDAFGVELDADPDRGDLWRSKDGSNDHGVRMERLEAFHRWVWENGIPTTSFSIARREHSAK